MFGGPSAACGPRVTFCGAVIVNRTGDTDTRVAVRVASGLDVDTTGVATAVAIGVASPVTTVVTSPVTTGVAAVVTTGVTRPVTRGFGGFRAAGKTAAARLGRTEERDQAWGGENRPAAVATRAGTQLVTQLPPIARAVDSARDVRRLVRREERVV